jgi:hypothetical protein
LFPAWPWARWSTCIADALLGGWADISLFRGPALHGFFNLKTWVTPIAGVSSPAARLQPVWQAVWPADGTPVAALIVPGQPGQRAGGRRAVSAGAGIVPVTVGAILLLALTEGSPHWLNLRIAASSRSLRACPAWRFPRSLLMLPSDAATGLFGWIPLRTASAENLPGKSAVSSGARAPAMPQGNHRIHRTTV